MPSKLRRSIAVNAAKLIYSREESEYYRAKMKAARHVHKGWVKPRDLPSNAEIRDEVRLLTRLYLGDQATEYLLEMRICALELMKILKQFSPKIIGSVLTGHVRPGSDIDLHLFSHSIDRIRSELAFHGYHGELVEKRVVKGGIRKVYRHLKMESRFPIELTIYSVAEKRTKFISSITGKPIESATLLEFEEFLKREYSKEEIHNEVQLQNEKVDLFDYIYGLMLPLEDIKQSRIHHPEGDVLYHSLQVFDLACDQKPYDQEFLLAALLHDVGKGIDPFDHVQSGVESLVDFLSSRSIWLIENHMVAHKIADRTIGLRLHKRLRTNENYEDLLILQECDRRGRLPGIETSSLEEAIEYLRDLDRMCFGV